MFSRSSHAGDASWWTTKVLTMFAFKCQGCKVLILSFVVCRNEEPHVKKRMGKHGEKVDLILRVDLVKYFVNM